jgi:hypothetical protein
MKLLKTIKNLVCKMCNSKLNQLITDLKNKNTYLTLKYNEQSKYVDTVRDKLKKTQANYYKIKGEYEKLLKEGKYYTPNKEKIKVPDIINLDGYPYLPYWKVFYYGNGIENKKIRFTPSKFYKIWSDDMFTYFKTRTKGLTKFDSIVVKIRDLVNDLIDYESDINVNLKAGENWRMPTETFYSGIGDCEDTTILWLTACKILELSPERVFNATGYFKDGGHSFGIAKFDDDEWYVIETTSKSNPIKLKDSNYRISGSLNGLTNWEFSGTAKKEQF